MPKHSAAAHCAGNLKCTRCQDSIEFIGGFMDADVTVERGSAKCQLAQVVHSGDGGGVDEEVED